MHSQLSSLSRIAKWYTITWISLMKSKAGEMMYMGLVNSYPSGGSKGPVRHGRMISCRGLSSGTAPGGILKAIPISSHEICIPSEVTVSFQGVPRKWIPRNCGSSVSVEQGGFTTWVSGGDWKVYMTIHTLTHTVGPLYTGHPWDSVLFSELSCFQGLNDKHVYLGLQQSSF